METSLFGLLVLSLGNASLVAMGFVPDPEQNQTLVDLPAAKSHIEMLSMLQEKTKGNLTIEESHLIEDLLYDLRMKYIEASKRSC